jgi:hypothetical protein
VRLRLGLARTLAVAGALAFALHDGHGADPHPFRIGSYWMHDGYWVGTSAPPVRRSHAPPAGLDPAAQSPQRLRDVSGGLGRPAGARVDIDALRRGGTVVWLRRNGDWVRRVVELPAE